MAGELKPCEDCVAGAHGPNYHRRHLPEALAAAGVYPEIVAYLNECHKDIIKLRAERDRERQRADAAEEAERRMLEQRQEMAAERYVWQERGDRAEAERDRFRAAWKNARWYATGFRERYRYERKLCRDADVRASKAIRAQLAAEAERDRARSIAVALEQQNARALELLRRLNPERRELLEVIAVLAGDDE